MTTLLVTHPAGLDHIQLSFQDSTQELNDFLSSTRTFDLKQRVAASINPRSSDHVDGSSWTSETSAPIARATSNNDW